MKTSLTHVRINVSDINQSIKWYEEILGFVVTTRYPAENPTYIGFEDELGAGFSIQQEENVPSYGRFNFQVDDVQLLWEKTKDRATVIEELWTTPWGTTKFTISDPDGNELGFMK
ncbi:VOC family protein [Alicyclobacillus fodiniaquatilis]|uniref:VOC family protein n=1 Tax=Alicyclobacillus fodiniaquatilis TaxID=1661150 RepID=A0ABW4JM76_9BACL